MIKAKVLLLTFMMLTMTEMSAQASDKQFLISVNGKTLTATFAENSSAAAFRDLIAEAPLTVEMSDYGDFEKVGSLGCSLPTGDTRITTRPGDVILYQGRNITIYYDVNTWSFTRLGAVDGKPTREAMLSVLGHGDAVVTFSLPREASASVVNRDSLSVRVSGRTVTIDGAVASDITTIYCADGRCVYEGRERRVALPAAGIYMVCCGSAKAKVMIR
ncbi:MAG: cyclophilin-like fold protein [Muribaculaceae bacterium]|nr:cyclophilin-like fold protein [Muribaculaceae bacterium]